MEPIRSLKSQLRRKELIYSLDSASSTVKPEIGSNYNSPTLSATTNLSDEHPAASSITKEIESPIGSTSGSHGKLAEGAPNVPLRSSSNAQGKNISSSSMPETASADPVSISRRGSQASIKPKSRTASLASSKRSNKERAIAPTASNQDINTGDPSTSPKSPKKRAGFLSFLNCCSPPKNANTVELGDQAVPAKKAKVLERKPGRQPTPVVKPNASAGESTTGESRENTEDNIGGPEYSEMKSATKPLMVTRSSKEKVTTEKVGPPIAAPAPEEPKETPAPAAYRDPPLPPVPAPTVPLVPSTQDSKVEQGIPTQAAVIAAAPQVIEPEESVAEQGTTINDRTPQQEQRDSDIAMVDAPPVVPTTDEQTNTTRELQQAQINLPPPPPRNANGAPSTSTSAAPSERHQWLLPPLQPQLKGRKCLVLDLDETLVHSSFKVCKRVFLCIRR